jgi:hypothetical protein
MARRVKPVADWTRSGVVVGSDGRRWWWDKGSGRMTELKPAQAR